MTETLLYAVGMDVLGSASVILTLRHIHSASCVMRKELLCQWRKFITRFLLQKEEHMIETI